jgi:hypothetical protein
VVLNYGDSAHPTSASGSIGSGSVSIAGLSITDQFLAAVNNTNTSLSDQSLSGIFGIGFPNPLSGSVIFASEARFILGLVADALTGLFPVDLIKQTLGPAPASGSRPIDAAITDGFISALPSQGPFLSRLVANGQLRQPMFTVRVFYIVCTGRRLIASHQVTLEREDVEVGGNVGQLTIGQLPDGVSNDSLTWVPVRLYTPNEGGLAGSTSNPNEVRSCAYCPYYKAS